MRILIVLGVLVGLTKGVWAESVSVRAGEHPNFSRLVFETDGQVSWHLGRVDEGYLISFEPKFTEFEMASVFQKIPRSRILDLGEQESGLLIATNCVCNVQAFELRPGVLIVDVFDGAPGENAKFENPHPSTVVKPAPKQVVQIETAALSNPKIFGNFLPKEPVESQQQLPAAHIADVQKRLVDQIGRAATQGLVQPKIPEVPDQSVSPEGSEETEAGIDARAENILVTTSIDRDLETFRPSRSQASQNVCLPSEWFDISSWGGESYAEDIGAAFGQSVMEFDETTEESIRTLFRAYGYWGFGIEAKTVLEQFETPPEERAYLEAMAEILDGEGAHEPSLFAGQASCDSVVALWAVLADEKLIKSKQLKTSAILSSFSALPLHLRRNLGPRMIDRFLSISDHNSAAAIKSAIDRAAGNHGSAFELSKAHIEQADADTDAVTELEEISRANDESSVLATIALIETLIRKNDPVPDDLVVAAEAYAFEYRFSAQETDLKRVILRASAHQGDVQKTLSLMQEVKLQISDPVLQDVINSMTENAEDDAFARFAFVLSQPSLKRHLPTSEVSSVLSRVLDLGFVEQAQKIAKAAGVNRIERSVRSRLEAVGIAAMKPVSGSSVHDQNSETRLLAGMEDSQSNERTILEAENDNAAILAAWQRDDWQSILQQGDDSQKQFAKAVLDLPKADTLSSTDAPPKLHQVKELLDTNQNFRAAAGQLLQ